MEGIQPLLPQGPVRAKPLVDLGEWRGAEAIDPALRILADLDKPRLPQDPQVPRYARASNRKQGRQLTGGRRTARQRPKDRPPSIVRNGPQNSFHGR